MPFAINGRRSARRAPLESVESPMTPNRLTQYFNNIIENCTVRLRNPHLYAQNSAEDSVYSSPTPSPRNRSWSEESISLIDSRAPHNNPSMTNGSVAPLSRTAPELPGTGFDESSVSLLLPSSTQQFTHNNPASNFRTLRNTTTSNITTLLSTPPRHIPTLARTPAHNDVTLPRNPAITFVFRFLYQTNHGKYVGSMRLPLNTSYTQFLRALTRETRQQHPPKRVYMRIVTMGSSETRFWVESPHDGRWTIQASGKAIIRNEIEWQEFGSYVVGALERNMDVEVGEGSSSSSSSGAATVDVGVWVSYYPN